MSNVKIRVIESKASNFAETLTNNISNTFKCDIDDVQWDDSSYPEKAKLSFVVYNVSAKTAGDIRDKVEQYLSDSGYDIWIGHSVDFEKDASYVGGSIKSAYRIYFSVKKEEAEDEGRSKAVKENFYSTHQDVLKRVKITSLQPGDLVLIVNGMYEQGVGEIIRIYEDYPSSDLAKRGISRLYCYDAKVVKSLNDSVSEGTQYSGIEYSDSILKLTDPTILAEAKSSSSPVGGNNASTFLSQLENEVKTAVKKFMMQPHIGFPEDEVEEYSNVKIKLEGEHIEIQVGAELSYEPLEELCTALNTVIAKYDHNAYFEPECPGRIVAYLMQYPYLENKSSDLTEALDLGNDGSSDDSYTHYTFTFNGQRYSFQECHDNYKVAYHRNKDFINGIYPYDDADHPWAYSNHNDTKWKIVKAGKTIDTIDSDDLQPVLQLLQKYDKDVEPRIIHN